MRRIAIFSAILLSTLSLAACGDGKEDHKTTETRMDDIDSLEGTISDDSINTDASMEEAPIDAEAPATKAVKSGGKEPEKAEEIKAVDSPTVEPAPAPEPKAAESGE